jgi:adenine phosphoribosyltransferase
MPVQPVSVDDIRRAIRNVPDFPQAGIQFKDITPVLGDPRLFAGCVDLLAGRFAPGEVDAVVGIDARGFILAAAVAYKLRAAFVPIRKRGKLPFKTYEQSYDLEYGSNTVALHVDAVKPGCRALLVDDLLATGGTAWAAVELLKQVDARVLEICFMIELGFLDGRKRLAGLPVRSLVTF